MAGGNRARLVPPLPRRAWLVIAAAGVTWIGGGLVRPYLLVYLADVRHLPPATAGAILSVAGVGAIVGTPLTGVLADRWGAWATLAASLLVTGAGAASLVLTHDIATICVATFAFGLGQRTSLPAGSTLLFGHTPERLRSHAFAMRYAVVNAATGIGGLAGGFIVTLHRPASFDVVFLAQGALCLGAVAVLCGVPRGRLSTTDSAGTAKPHRDRVFIRIWLLTLVAYTISVAQLTTGFAQYVTGPLGGSPATLGTAYAISTFAVAGAQLPVLRMAAGRRRMAVVTVLYLALAGTWLLASLAAGLSGSSRTAVVYATALAFGIAESLIPPSLPPAAAQLAPPGAQGRYNAAYSTALSLGATVAPLVGGLLIAGGRLALPLSLAGCAALGTIGAARSHRRMPDTITRIPTG